MAAALLLMMTLLTPLLQEARTGRLRPPEALTCDRNKLTSFTGKVTQWSRDSSTAHLRMNTDADTREDFTVRFEKGMPPEKWFLLGGRVFRPEDWSQVELAQGRLRAEIQATVWVCEGGANPVIDWRIPAK